MSTEPRKVNSRDEALASTKVGERILIGDRENYYAIYRRLDSRTAESKWRRLMGDDPNWFLEEGLFTR